MFFTYGMSVGAGTDFDKAMENVVGGLKAEGFWVVSDIDMQALFKEKLAVDEPRYRIIGVCNPSLAYQALRADRNIGVLLPCNVVVREDKRGNVTVAFPAPEAVLGLVNRDDVTKLGMEVRQRLERVANSIQS